MLRAQPSERSSEASKTKRLSKLVGRTPWSAAGPPAGFFLWALTLVYASARVLQLYPAVPMLWVVALHVIPPALFTLIHGSALYGPRGILTFMALCLTIGNLFENLGVLTGFPFGHYYFTDLMGPKLFQVPILLGPAYLGMGYLSWTLARLILGRGSRVIALPLVASFIMVAWDLSMDPVWSTIKHAWIWLDGGPYFGVPISNFFGWYLTVYIIYQSFALYLRTRPTSPELPVNYWRLPIVFYAVSALGNILLVIPAAQSIVTDATGARWKVSSITGATAIVSIFTMGAFALLAWIKLAAKPVASQLRAAEPYPN